MRKFVGVFASSLLLGASSVSAACGIEAGSVRILSNDFAALGTVIDEARECAADGVTVSANLTTEHKSLQVPALTVDPSRYSVAMVANNSLVPLLNEGLVRPLDDLVAEYGDQLEDRQLVRIGGEIVAIAFMVNAQHLYLRQDLLEEAGIDAPTSYEGILEAARTLKESGVSDTPLGAADAAGWDLAAEFVNMHLGMGGDFFEQGSAAPALANETGLRTLEMMKALTEFMAPGYMTVSADELKNQYVSGNVAMMNEWGSMVDGIVGAAASDRQIAEATTLAAAPTVGGGGIPAAALWWDGFVIADNISDEDAAASFQVMMHAIRPEVAQDNPQAAAWLISGFDAPESARGMLATAEAGARPYPMTPYMGLMHDTLGVELVQFMQGTESAEQALADVEAAYSAAAREAGYLN
ncbi:ABC-type glycerol-3-phosphate transport system substrate-binding protein [Palleronia aestuarii]|uniref:ABC-type glycerol-3-phosphate transport system substrate-binding protein n=1 Tax=Palleronia aestuarii TaxID=568105 RepID=A0A2W7MUN7_9RHOB|nr:extracellular solute-binding protein [Palleronia aestuarii]PZX11253.1 ABC-type glycerol-3-phosphate transport system substrate-binding protein [Palleronia aestuarii]